MTYNNLNIEFVDKHVGVLARYLYELASIVEGDKPRWEIYMDAADALMDVVRMWAEDEADPSTGAATA